MIDLHTHSNKSDGSYTPTELIDYAIEKGITALALTDHDTMEGVEEALGHADIINHRAGLDGEQAAILNGDKAMMGKGIEVIPGIEVTADYNGKDIHIVGLFVDKNVPGFDKQLKDFKDSRDLRNIKMCKLLNEHGIDISMEEMEAEYPNQVITRGQFSRQLLKKGYTKSLPEAFERYIGDHCDCYVPREKITARQALDFIHSGSGIAILAHPTLYHMSNDNIEKLVAFLKEQGVDGIEGKYTTYTSSEERMVKELAKKYELQISGGSDFHGAAKPKTDLGIGHGKLYIHESILENLKAYRAELYRII